MTDHHCTMVSRGQKGPELGPEMKRYASRDAKHLSMKCNKMKTNLPLRDDKALRALSSLRGKLVGGKFPRWAKIGCENATVGKNGLIGISGTSPMKRFSMA